MRAELNAAGLAHVSLKPMSTAPLVAILAVHFENGPVEIRPDHEANFWLPERSWWMDDEGPSHPESDFVGWIAECAE